MRRIAACLLATLALVGCAETKAPPLEGKRIEILPGKALLRPDASLQATSMVLPAEERNLNWAQSGGDSAHFMAHLEISNKVTQAWRESIGGGSSDTKILMNPPVVANGKVYIINTKGNLVALDLGSGDEVWDRKIILKEKEHLEYSGGLAVSEGKLIVTTGTGEVFAFDSENGEVVWAEDVGVPLRSAPTIEGGKVFVLGHNNSLSVLGLDDGRLLWTHSGIEEGLAIMGGASPAVHGSTVIVPYSSGEIYALNADNGAYLWHDALSVSIGGGDIYSSLVDVEGMPVIAGGVVYAVNYNGRLSAFELRSGRRLWSVPLSAVEMPWVAGNAVFVVTEENQLVSLHRTDGRVRYVTDLNAGLEEDDLEDGIVWSGPVLAGGRLIVVSSTGHALSIDPQSGKVMRAIEVKDGISLPPVVADGTLIFLTDDAKVLAFR